MPQMKPAGRALVLGAVWTLLLPLGGCGTCDESIEVETVEAAHMEGEHDGDWIVGYRFFCNDDLHFPKGVWRGSLNRTEAAATKEAEIHRRRWDCALAETMIRAEK
ncbi:MAG: hypothetical protein KDB53_16215 [Planctomycetes bacterium]|nr:hypothetical protein [Planctomycetota bacterium]